MAGREVALACGIRLCHFRVLAEVVSEADVLGVRSVFPAAIGPVIRQTTGSTGRAYAPEGV
jgi:hypothetical protein